MLTDIHIDYIKESTIKFEKDSVETIHNLSIITNDSRVNVLNYSQQEIEKLIQTIVNNSAIVSGDQINIEEHVNKVLKNMTERNNEDITNATELNSK